MTEEILTSLALASALPIVVRAARDLLSSFRRRRDAKLRAVDAESRLLRVIGEPNIDPKTEDLIKRVVREGRAESFLKELGDT
jgi:hypothetical protein